MNYKKMKLKKYADVFPDFPLLAKRVDIELSRWCALSALSSLSAMTHLTLLQNSSFLPEIKENLTLIPCKEVSTEQRSKQSNFI